MAKRTKPARRARGRAPARASTAGKPPERPETHVQSPTAVAAEAMSTGVAPRSRVAHVGHQAGRESDLLRVGDVETKPLQNAFVGDETPGGDMPTPDQDLVDEIGRAYGVQDADTGVLRSSSELLDERDRQRSRLEGPRPTRGTRDADRTRTR